MCKPAAWRVFRGLDGGNADRKFGTTRLPWPFGCLGESRLLVPRFNNSRALGTGSKNLSRGDVSSQGLT
ncbi:hypothetical protein NPIL_425811 [Nephila pilipes]|uniref:Uncharacterized protein n=1 Tax=Nephila pilipes TaxID=299642 RepID=A0A8X6PLD9_NEPPI|nr:hypothetical protein NPIL_425811 [Nephila pilipes]